MVNTDEPLSPVREDGFYWVTQGQREPQVMEWGDGYWWAAGTEIAVPDLDVRVVSARLAAPAGASASEASDEELVRRTAEAEHDEAMDRLYGKDDKAELR